MPEFLQQFKERKLFQWAAAYVAGAWVVLQVLDVLADLIGFVGGRRTGMMTMATAKPGANTP